MNTLERNTRRHCRAWCSGKGYNYPTKALFIDNQKYIKIWTGSIPLADFTFNTKVAYELSKRSVRRYLKIGRTLNQILKCCSGKI